MTRALGALAALVLWASPAQGQRKPEVQGTPTFSAEVNYVEVDATVTDQDGAFVRGLGREDFEVLEDGKPQELSTFGMVDLPLRIADRPNPAAPPAAEPDVRTNDAAGQERIFVLVLDDLHTRALRSASVKNVARQFLERYVGPGDLVSIVHTSGRAGASQEFTRSRGLLLASVDRFVGRKLRSATLERLDEYQRERGTQSRADQRMRQVTDPLDAERARDAERTLRTLQNLGELLSRTRGRRKAVVMISEGIDYELQAAVTQTASGISTFTSPEGQAVSAHLRDAVAAMTRGNVAIYGIDPTGIATGAEDAIEVDAYPETPLLGLSPTAFEDEARRGQDSLRVLSEQTGGAAAVGSNDFAPAFERILRDSSSYYMLGYRSSNGGRDRRFRRIEVRSRKPGVRVRARSGYYAGGEDRPEPAAGGKMSTAARALLDNAVPVTGLGLTAFAAPFKGAGGNASVLVGLEVAAGTLRFAEEGGLHTDKLEAAVVAVDDQGRFVQGDDTTVALRLTPESHAAVEAHGLRLLFRLALAPGSYQLRAAALDAAAGGSVHYDVQVPDFSREALSLSGLVLSSSSAGATPTPREDADLGALLRDPPTAARAFAATESLGVLFALYHDPKQETGAVAITTSVTSLEGRVRFSDEMQVSAEEFSASPGGFGYVVKVPLEKIEPGSYVLRVAARSRQAPGIAPSREIPFEVTAETAVR